MDVTDDKGHKVINHNWSGKIQRRGWHAIAAYAQVPTAYEANVTYTATADLQRSECEF
jgi:hypothetical protein